MERIHWREWVVLLLVIMCVIIAIDVYFGAHYIGATMRFLWNAMALFFQSVARTIEASFALLLRQRAKRILTGLFTAVGLVYVSHLILTDSQVKQAHDWREKMRATTRVLASHLRAQWLQLPFIGKCAIVALIIAAQVYFVPTIAEWFVIFPIAFLVPVLKSIKHAVTSWLVDSYFGTWYWQKCGRAHHATIGGMRRIPGVREVIGGIRRIRLQYITAWRMWKHDPCYRFAKSERRRISLYEPLRLWWLGELNRYMGRPLLSGTYPRPCSSYEPPVLWYDHESPWSQLTRRILGVAMMFAVAAGVQSSRRR